MNIRDRLVTNLVVTKKDLNTSNKDVNLIIKNLLDLIKNQVQTISNWWILMDWNIVLSCEKINDALNNLQSVSKEIIWEIKKALLFLRCIFSWIEELAWNLERCENTTSCIEVLENAKKWQNKLTLTNRILCIILRKCETIEEAEDLISNHFKVLKLDVYTYIELIKIIVKQNNISIYWNKLIKYLNALNNIKWAWTWAEFQNALRSLKWNFWAYSDLVEKHIRWIWWENNLLSLLQK